MLDRDWPRAAATHPAFVAGPPSRGSRQLRVVVTLLCFAVAGLARSIARRFQRAPPPSPTPAKLRELCEELGGLFIKFGQFIAMRPDIAAPEFVREAERLLDKVPSFPGQIAIRTIEQELDAPIDRLFSYFDPQAIAAASFAQVHRATLPCGTAVAVKVLRPGLERSVHSDLRTLRFIVWLLELSGFTRSLRLGETLDELEHWTLEELDLRKEAAFATAMRESEVEIPSEYIPRVYWSHTNRRVMTMEFLQGIWMSDIKAAAETGTSRPRDRAAPDIRRKEVALAIFENTLRQTFERNMFHADPHAGNLIVLADGRIGYVDFGITGQVDARFRDIQLAVLTSLAAADVDSYFRAAIKFFYPLPGNADVVAIRREVIAVARNWINAQYNRRATLTERGTALLVTNILKVARRHELVISPIALRYFRAVVTVEALILLLDPDFAYRQHLRRVLLAIEIRAIRRRNTPAAAATALVGLLSLSQTLPQSLIRSFADLDDTRRTLNGSLWLARSSLVWSLYFAARLGGLAALALIINLALGVRPIDVGVAWISIAALICGSIFLASLARRLRLSSLPATED